MAIKDRAPVWRRSSSKANCRAHEMLARVGDKWSVPVIHVLGVEGTLPFGEILRRIPRIRQRMLAVTLRGLERDGLVRRNHVPGGAAAGVGGAVPPRQHEPPPGGLDRG
jgi:DNA-binding HxlR family transcriptional regulator